MRQVKGVLFLDYVRMLKAHKAADWIKELPPSDLPYLDKQIDTAGWYPMDTFERMGNAILRFVTAGELLPVRLWGRLSAAQMRAVNPTLLAPGDPVETLHRFERTQEMCRGGSGGVDGGAGPRRQRLRGTEMSHTRGERDDRGA